MRYYYQENFENLPSRSWALLLEKVLMEATHLGVCTGFSKGTFSEAFINAITSLPENIYRVYAATQRFRLTNAVISEVRSKEYQSWDSTDSEDPAFYQNDVLLLGTISHEDLVIMLLDEPDRNALNSSGFSFYKEYKF
ncbi:hypothetical protein QMK33_04115 [Hymenobacter sp. H14-R3]|uniref:hypothetical protein n=1 Tax=Hymenobacter sp. H14-R3 TaxID=3046308 RepID=UPI0024B9BE13|nr:hypothetical protein [Hymenobacter sp. H14-R3]MDJ0364324.1 hypothetical protein [Hymenobacter sp. H14-R3]